MPPLLQQMDCRSNLPNICAQPKSTRHPVVSLYNVNVICSAWEVDRSFLSVFFRFTDILDICF